MNVTEQRLETGNAALQEQLDAANQRIKELDARVEQHKRSFAEVIKANGEKHRRMEAAERKLATALGAIRNFLNGDYPHPEKYRPNHCAHGTEYYNECARCDIEHFDKALAQIEQSTEDVGMEQRCLDFVKGAKWWEWTKNNATMWQSDQHAAYEAAKLLFSGSSEPWPPEHTPRQAQAKQQLPGEDPPFEPCQCSACVALRSKAENRD